MSWHPTAPEKKVRDALAVHGRKLKETRPCEWQAELRNGRPFQVRARVQGQWLTLDANPDDNGKKADPWQILLEARGLGNEAQAFMDPRTGELGIRAEILLQEEVDLSERVGVACSALVQAVAHLVKPGAPPGEPPPISPGSMGARLGSILSGDGWVWEERDDGSLSVALNEPEGGRCRLTLGSNEGLLLRTELTKGPSGSTQQRRAMATFLLTGTGLVRLVQGYANPDGEEDRVGLGIVLHSDPSPPELTHGLSALSLATHHLRHTAGALLEPAVAERYLQIRVSETKTTGAKSSGGPKGKGEEKGRPKRRSTVETACTPSRGGKG